MPILTGDERAVLGMRHDRVNIIAQRPVFRANSRSMSHCIISGSRLCMEFSISEARCIRVFIRFKRLISHYRPA
jgi:hypothetical protein